MIEPLNAENIYYCAEMASELWPESEATLHQDELYTMLEEDKAICYLYKTSSGAYIGFIQLSLRNDYVEGCTTSPVTYIEGIFVKEGYRKSGVAAKLVKAGEKWGKEKGCTEMAADIEMNNEGSYYFHKAVGFTEANRIICFAKQIE